jgi:hypothetical protein
MRVTVYKNSVLATVCSLFGTCIMAGGVIMLVGGISSDSGMIVPGLIMGAVGFGLMLLGNSISEKKAEKQLEEQQMRQVMPDQQQQLLIRQQREELLRRQQEQSAFQQQQELLRQQRRQPPAPQWHTDAEL